MDAMKGSVTRWIHSDRSKNQLNGRESNQLAARSDELSHLYVPTLASYSRMNVSDQTGNPDLLKEIEYLKNAHSFLPLVED